MRRSACILGGIVLVLAGTAAGDICGQCKGKVYTMDVGKCAACGGAARSGAFVLCRSCSLRLGQCEHCRAALPGGPRPDLAGPAPKPLPEATQPAPAGPTGPAGRTELKDPGSYKSGKWEYQFKVSGVFCWLYYDGKKVPQPKDVGAYYKTPWGEIQWVGSPRDPEALRGWAPRPAGARGGKELPLPGTEAPVEELTAGKFDPEKSGKYVSGKWRYELEVIGRRTRDEQRFGTLTYDGKPIPNAVKYDRLETPWGTLTYLPRTERTGGWLVSYYDRGARWGRLLPSPPLAVPAPPPPLRLDESHNGKTVEAAVAQEVLITLPAEFAHPATGTWWKVVKIGGGGVEAAGAARFVYDGPEPKVGEPARSEIGFLCITGGSARIELGYVEAGQRAKPPAKTFAVTVNVKGAGGEQPAPVRGRPASRPGGENGIPESTTIKGN